MLSLHQKEIYMRSIITIFIEAAAIMVISLGLVFFQGCAGIQTTESTCVDNTRYALNTWHRNHPDDALFVAIGRVKKDCSDPAYTPRAASVLMTKWNYCRSQLIGNMEATYMPTVMIF